MTEALVTTDLLLGRIPSGWEVQPLKRLVQVQSTGSYGTNPSSELINLPVATTAQIDSVGRFRVEKMPKRGFTERESLRFICRPNDILVVKSSGSMANIITGKLGIVDQFIQPFVFSNFLLRLVPSDSRIKPRFIYHVLGSHLTVERIRRMVSGSTYPNLKTKEYLSALIPFPSIEDQVLILRYLDNAELRIAKAIQAKQRMVALLNEQKQVIISELVNRGLNPDVPMRDSGVLGLGEIPASWELVRAKSIWRPVVSRSQTGLEQLLSVSSKFGPVPRKNLNVTMFMANSYVGHKRVRVNDLVINSLWSWAYGLGVSKHEGLVSTAYSVFELINPTVVDPDYMNYLLRSAPMQWQFQVNSKGIWKSRLQLTDSSFGSFTLPLPPTDEQRAIASSIEIKTKNIEDAIVAVEREIELLKEYRTVLISDVVTGKKDVRAEAAELSDIDPAELAQVLSGAVSDDGEEDEDDGASENE